MTDHPPPEVQAAAAVVNRYLQSRDAAATKSEPPQLAGRVSDAEFAKMSAGQRLDYARQFPQPQLNGAAR